MPQLLDSGLHSVIDSSSAIGVGWKLNFYTTGTSTRKATYPTLADAIALTNAHSNPITLPADGRLPSVWLLDDARYKCVLTDENDVVRKTIDPVNLGAVASGDISFLQAGTGALSRTTQGKLRESISVLDFIAESLHAAILAKTSTVDVATQVQAAVNYIQSIGGGTLEFPAGQFTIGSTINLCAKLRMRGAGKRDTILRCTMAGGSASASGGLTAAGATLLSGTALRMSSPINASTGVFIDVEDMTVYSTSGSNVGAGFYDTGGTFIRLTNVYIHSFKHQVVLDQSELAHIDSCYLECTTAAGSCLWLVQGADLSVGASGGFTNQITVTRNQINGTSTNLVLDDGGYAHEYHGNNFNGGTNYFRIACADACLITGGEYEAGATAILATASTLSGLVSGASQITIVGGIWVCATVVNATGLAALTMVGMQTSATTLVLGADNIGSLARLGGTHTGGTIYSGNAAVINDGYLHTYPETGTAITATYVHTNKHVRCTNAGAITFTVAPNVDWPAVIGTTVDLEQGGAGTVTIAPGAGVTLRSRGGLLNTNGQYAVVKLTKIGTNEWNVAGDRA